MLLNTAPQDTAVLSNVGQIGEFRIRNSAKAFGILSSGLYANKIRAIVRELSCNAVDSHVAAGNSGTPFDVHLPNSFEPWFSIRDYGTGLDHDQITNIYTTYFESTKTESNDFIGALGLGSKSPFSYTDNFTVTSIKDGVKGIYSAFINEYGVPSIANMLLADSTEPNGVEVKFSVNDQHDYQTFKAEAAHIYSRFAVTPVVSGVSDFKPNELKYTYRDIVPGVHIIDIPSHYYRAESIAVMGHIAYPIDIPESRNELGDLQAVLEAGLEFNFEIGELDFQASREGLSYIPSTIAAIKSKLQQVKQALGSRLTEDADAIDNLWDRADFLNNMSNVRLWAEAAREYAARTQLPTTNYTASRGYMPPLILRISDDETAEKFNIAIRGFHYSSYSNACTELKKYNLHTNVKATDVDGNDIIKTVTVSKTEITVMGESSFVENDTNIGAVERVRYHYRTSKSKDNTNIYILEKADKTKEMDLDGFYKSIFNPNTVNITQVSKLLKKEKSTVTLKNIGVMKLVRNNRHYYDDGNVTWKDVREMVNGDVSDNTQTYYYLPLKGFEVQSKYNLKSASDLHRNLKDCGIPKLNVSIYGVRKTDINRIEQLPNWINVEDFIVETLSKSTQPQVVNSLKCQILDTWPGICYTKELNTLITDPNSMYIKFTNMFEESDTARDNARLNSLSSLVSLYAKDKSQEYEKEVEIFQSALSAVSHRYPLFLHLRSPSSQEMADYINLIDSTQGV